MNDTNSIKTGLVTVQNNSTIIVSACILLAIGFFIGSLWTENKLLKSGTSAVAAQDGSQVTPPPQPTVGTASVDDDPVLGDENAPITIVEFSDYECPFCKKYFDDTFPQIKAKYIDTGKVKLVFRDLPLSFHDPMATKEAVGANCAKKQGGDEKYFVYHDEIFKRTTSNGNGLNDQNLKEIATDIGLNLSQFETCLQDKTMEDEVKNDLADAGEAGATGTPTFIIGKSTKDGTINGNIVIGAQPFAAFEAIIDPLLK